MDKTIFSAHNFQRVQIATFPRMEVGPISLCQKLVRKVMEEVAQGRITIVCVRKASDGGLSASSLPEVIREKIQAAPAERLIP